LNPPRPNRISFYVFNPEGGEGVGSYFQDTLHQGRWIFVVGVADSTRTYMYRVMRTIDGAIHIAARRRVNALSTTSRTTSNWRSIRPPDHRLSVLGHAISTASLKAACRG